MTPTQANELVIVFGTDTLAGSCAVGRKNLTTTAPSSLKLNVITGAQYYC